MPRIPPPNSAATCASCPRSARLALPFVIDARSLVIIALPAPVCWCDRSVISVAERARPRASGC